MILCFDEEAPDHAKAAPMSVLDETAAVDPIGVLPQFRSGFRDRFTARGDTLFELCKALFCSPHSVTSLVESPLEAEHRRGHGAMYNALDEGRLAENRLRRPLASLLLPRAAVISLSPGYMVRCPGWGQGQGRQPHP